MGWKIGHICPYWPKLWPIHLLSMDPTLGCLPVVSFPHPTQIAQFLPPFLLPRFPALLSHCLLLLIIGVAYPLYLLSLPVGWYFLGASPTSLIAMLFGPISFIFLDTQVYWWHVYVLGMAWSILHLSWKLALPSCSAAA